MRFKPRIYLSEQTTKRYRIPIGSTIKILMVKPKHSHVHVVVFVFFVSRLNSILNWPIIVTFERPHISFWCLLQLAMRCGSLSTFEGLNVSLISKVVSILDFWVGCQISHTYVYVELNFKKPKWTNDWTQRQTNDLSSENWKLAYLFKQVALTRSHKKRRANHEWNVYHIVNKINMK